MPEPVILITDRIERLPVMHSPEHITLLPSSGDVHDTAGSAIAKGRATQGFNSRIAVPSWRGRFANGLDRRLFPGPCACVVDAGRVRLQGPLVLDLVASYTSPVQRGRILASPRRLDLALQTFARVNPRRMIVRADDALWLEVRDPVAAELVALTLRQHLYSGEEWPTPWEDELVQRATELDVGVRLPQEITVGLAAQDRSMVQHPVVLALALRTGVDIPVS